MMQNYKNKFDAGLPDPLLRSTKPANRRCFGLKHELNGVSYAADVSAPRKV